jgi:hypothetical protein
VNSLGNAVRDTHGVVAPLELAPDAAGGLTNEQNAGLLGKHAADLGRAEAPSVGQGLGVIVEFMRSGHVG